jgi:predicted DNA-binding protein
MANTPVHSLRVDDALWNRLVEIADNNGVSKAVIIRAAIEYYIWRVEKENG